MSFWSDIKKRMILNIWYIHIAVYYSVISRNKLLINTTLCINLQNIMLKEKCQKKSVRKKKLHDPIYMKFYIKQIHVERSQHSKKLTGKEQKELFLRWLLCSTFWQRCWVIWMCAFVKSPGSVQFIIDKLCFNYKILKEKIWWYFLFHLCFQQVWRLIFLCSWNIFILSYINSHNKH